MVPSQRILPVRIPFRLPLNAEKSVDRFVYTYVLVGKEIAIVDTGVAGGEAPIVAALAALGKSPADVAWVVNTHEHPDHIGGNGFFQVHGRPRYACHAQAVRWIQDLEAQYRDRPLYDFFKLTGKAIHVTHPLQEGDELDLGNDMMVQVLHTPGHSPGSLSLFCPSEGALITADAIQPVGGLPLYSDLETTRASLRRLLTVPNVRLLFRSHSDTPYTGSEIQAVVQSGLDYLDRVDAAVRAAFQQLGGDATPEDLTRETLIRLDLASPPVTPIVVQSIMSHFKKANAPELA